jgi:Gram-negative bacterial TonB protein C-terminal
MFLSIVIAMAFAQPSFSQSLAPIKIVGMEYPPIWVLARISGVVKMKCSVAPSGKVVSTEITDPTSGALPETTGKAVKENIVQWVFPTGESERSVEITYKFILIGKPDPAKTSKFVFESPDTVTVTAEYSTRIIVD